MGADAAALGAALGAEPEPEPEPAPEPEPPPPGADWAAALRDRLVCVLYSRLFTWLINAVNEHIKVYRPPLCGRCIYTTKRIYSLA